jgi:hypothetical protein
MKILKAILRQMVDLLFGLITLGLFIAWMINTSINVTYFLALVVGYVTFNIINKIKMQLKEDE